MNIHKHRGIALAVTAALSSSIASAQVLEEVLVTAQKREQSLQDVGIAVSAFTGDQIQQLGFTNSTDVAAMSPGVFISGSAAGQNAQFTVRGVTQNDFLDAIEGPTAIYLDEGYVAQQNGGTFGMFDIERVEILKGPQGTLFGRNATGGLVHYITRKPTDTPEAYVDLSYGRFDMVNVQAAMSGPLAENLRARAAIYYKGHDGILKNEFPLASLGASGPGVDVNGLGEDGWEDNSLAGRVSLSFDINENAEFYLMGHGYTIDVDEGQYQNSPTIQVYDNAPGGGLALVDVLKAGPNETREAIGPGGVSIDTGFAAFGLPPGVAPATPRAPGADFFGYIDPDGDGRRTSKDFSPNDGNEYDNWGILGRLNWDLGWANLTWISDYKKFDRNLIVDVDAGPSNGLVFNTITDTSSFSQELRLDGETDRMRWVTGAYMLMVDADVTNGFILPPDSLFGFTGGILPFAVADGNGVPGAGSGGPTNANYSAPNSIKLDTDSFSIFGQLEYDISDQLTFIAGLRIIQEEKEYTLRSRACNQGADITEHSTADCPFNYPTSLEDPSGAAYTESTSDTLWAGKVQLDYRPTDDLLVYFGINRGVKAGAFNAPLPLTGVPLPQADIGYDEEILLTYEGGFKATVWDGKARINGSIYHYDYTDYHAFSFVGVSGIVRNQDATNTGVELDFVANPIDGMDFMFGISYFDFEVEDVAVSPGVIRDVEPAFAPAWQASGLIRYEWPFMNGNMAAQLDGNYRGTIYHNINNFSANKYGSAIFGNARLTWYAPDDKWQVAAFVQNIGNEREGTIGFDLAGLCGCNEDSYNAPRWWGVNLRYNFF